MVQGVGWGKLLIRGALFFVLLAGCAGCWGDTDDSRNGIQCPTQVELKPGETVGGHDPQTLLAPFFGTWVGTLTWADGADPRTTRLTLGVTQDPAQPSYRAYCPDGAYTYPDVSLVTDDGALDATTSAIAASVLPENYNYERESGLSISGVNVSPSIGTVAERILGLDRYTDGHIVLELTWDWPKSAPASGILSFTGSSIATGKSETFAIATWLVD